MRISDILVEKVVRLIWIVTAIMASALSVEAQERASSPEPGMAVTAPLFIPVAPVANRIGRPFADTQSDDVTPRQSSPAINGADKSIPHIALLLPLASKTFGKVGDALKQGFIAGAEADGKNAPPYRIYTADDEGASLAAQYRRAVSEGAYAIIGGMTRDGANIMARESRVLPTLALNAPATSIDNDFPDRFVYVSLSLDLEAVLVARMAADDGLHSIAMVVANDPLSKRVQESFEREWLRLGGEIATQITFGSDSGDTTRVATAMEKVSGRATAVFLAAGPKAARFVRPYLPAGMPAFATSQSIDPYAGSVANLDLDGVRFLEMPWFAQRDHPAVIAYAKPAQSLAVEYERLYALGIDAWRLGQLIVKSENMRSLLPLDGVTGRITLDGHQLNRALPSLEMRDGKSQLYRRNE